MSNNRSADSVNGIPPGLNGTGHVSRVATASTESAARQRAFNSAMAGITNAIELCDAAKLPALSHRLLEIQQDALKERER